MALFPKDVPDRCGKTLESRRHAQLLIAGIDLGVAAAGLSDPGKIAFDIRHENRDAKLTESLCEALERDSFSGAGRTRDDTVPVGHSRQKVKLGFVVFGYKYWICHTAVGSQLPVVSEPAFY